MRGRRSATRGRSRRRTVAWVPGLTTFNETTGANVRVFALAAVPNIANTYGFGVNLLADTDLSMHGGEDCVLVRILGTLRFFKMSNATAGAAPGQLRVLITKEDTRADATQQVREWVTSTALGRDDVLYTGSVLVAGTDWLTAIEPALGPLSLNGTLHVDVKAKRRVQSDSQIFLQVQGTFPAGNPAANVQVAGHLRLLLMRPR